MTKNFNNDYDNYSSKRIMNKVDVKEPNCVTKHFVQNEFVSPLHIVSGDRESGINHCRFNKLKKLMNIEEKMVIKNKDLSDIKNWNVNITTWADVDQNTYMCWGDYWVKQKMTEHLKKYVSNVNGNRNECDVTIYLFGSPYKIGVKNAPYNPLSYNILWLYSHPDKLSFDEAQKYDCIFCLSKNYLHEVKKIHNNVADEPLFGCTDFVMPIDIEYGSENDLVMVANARGAMAGYGREVVEFMVKSKTKYDIKVWGHKWSMKEKYPFFPQKWYVDRYYDYNDLNKLYRGAKAVIVDGHGTMEKNGFVPVKLFDIFASGGLPIIRKNIGINDLFGDYVLQYNNLSEFKKCLSILDDRERCLEIIEKGNNFARKYNYDKLVTRIINEIKDYVVEFQNIKNGNVSKVAGKESRRVIWVTD